MNRALLCASWAVVRRASVLVPVGAAVVLVAATWPVLDDGYALVVLRGVGVLLACAWLVSLDDPMGEVLDASPYPRVTRWGARVVVALGVVGPTWVVAAVVVDGRADVPVLAVGLEAAGLCAVGLAIAAGLRAWRGLLMPAHVAVVGALVAAFVSDALPRGWQMNQEQLWGPPWEAAHIRWAAVLLAGVAVLALAMRDPVGRAGQDR